MNKRCIFIRMTVLGWLGWRIGEMIGFMTAFGLSTLGSVLGIYKGWRIHQDYFN